MPATLQIGNNDGQQLAANTLAFRIREHCQYDNFSTASIPKTVADETISGVCRGSRKFTRFDLACPRLDCDAMLPKSCLRHRVLPCHPTQSDVLGCER